MLQLMNHTFAVALSVVQCLDTHCNTILVCGVTQVNVCSRTSVYWTLLSSVC